MENYLFEIQENQQMRLDKYLAEQFPEQTRSYLQKLIKKIFLKPLAISKKRNIRQVSS